MRSFLIFFFIALALITIEAKSKKSKSVSTSCTNTCVWGARCYTDYHPANEVIWARENGVCKVFANACLFGQYNCDVQNQCSKPLEAIKAKKCQKHCPKCKNEPTKPVCVTFGPNHSISFANHPNKCMADREACQTGIPYSNFAYGVCTVRSSS